MSRSPQTRAVSPLELFFDLVYVFAISQLSHHLLVTLTLRGALETLTMLCAVFTIWLHTAFEATFLDIARRATQVLVIVGMGLALFMNAGISGAYEHSPALFAVPLVVIQLLRPMMTSRLADVPVLRVHFRAMLAWMLCSTPFWLGGIVLDPEHRLWAWLVAAAIDVIGSLTAHPVPWRSKDVSELEFDGAHLQERLQLFLIIALGEVVLTTGTSISEAGHEAAAIAAGAAGFVLVASLWALYFAGADDIVEEMVESGENAIDESRIAGGVEYLIVIGLVMVAVGSELAVAHPLGHGSSTAGVLLCGGSLVYVLAQALFLRLTVASVSRARSVTGGLLVAIAAASALLPPLVVLVLLDALLLALAGHLAALRKVRLGRRAG